MRTEGTILELGCGWYSTPILHEIAVAQKRLLVTIDNNNDWLTEYKSLECEFHRLHLVGWWGDMPLEQRYGLAFVDQAQPCEREYTTRKIYDLVNVFVFHDTEEGPAYGYNRVLSMFKHQFTDKCHQAWTTVASNKVNVNEWELVQLPPVSPTEEVT